jgi:hypothetical protein
MAEVRTISQAAQDIVDVQPQRVTLIREPGSANPTVFPALFNPEILEEEINVQWSRLQVIGLDHEVPHYTNTRSLSYTLEFYWSEFQFFLRQRSASPSLTGDQRGSTANTQPQLERNAISFMNFLRSLCFPTRTGLRPPTLQVIWPTVFNLIGVVESVKFTFARFDTNLSPIVYRATVEFLETRATRRFSEDVAQIGLEPDARNNIEKLPTG